MQLYWAKVKENAVLPAKRKEDAGYDLYPCFEEDFIEIKPHETLLVPLGVASAFDEDCVLFLKERGSTGSRGISVRSGVMDSGYRGEYIAPITNLNTRPVRIIKEDVLEAMRDEEKAEFILYPYEKAICQGVLLRMPETEVRECSYEELKKMKSLRGEGRLGSSGK